MPHKMSCLAVRDAAAETMSAARVTTGQMNKKKNQTTAWSDFT